MEITNFIPTSGGWLYALITLVVLLGIQAFYYLYFFLFLGKEAKKKTGNDYFSYPDISIVICAKNESRNLEVFLPKVLDQDYPANFEVVVVNDASEDDTELVLAKLKMKYKNLYYTSIPYDKKFRHGKKLAMSIGIKAAKNNHMLFTDADCVPASDRWLKLMSEGFQDGKEIVLGYGPYQKKKGFLNLWVRYETFYIAALYFSFALRQKTYMGVGRNVAYTKELFNKHHGFKNHQHILSGDDDLFIRDAATNHNVAVVTHPDSYTISLPVNTFQDWKRQKRRHLTTSSLYKRNTKFLLATEALSRQLFWCISLVSVFFSTFATTVLLVMIIKLVLQVLVLRSLTKLFEERKLLWVSVILDFIQPLVIGLLLIGRNRQAKKNRWT